jgi:hypothetical protein
MTHRRRAVILTVLLTLLLPVAVAPATSALAVTVPCSATFRCSSISGQYQIQYNYCGPAVAATVLTNYRISGVSQPYLAGQLHTDSLGWTSPLVLDDVLNASIGGGLNPFVTYRSVTNAQLWDAVRYKVKNWGDVFIITVYAHKIWHPTAGTGVAHYLVIYGYSDQAGGYMVWDPAPSGGGAHHLSKNDWERVAYPGRFAVIPSL